MSYLKTLLGDAYVEGMSEEEIDKALESAGIGVAPAADGSLTGEVARLKRELGKSNGENADWKRKLRERQTEDERKAQEKAEQMEALKQERDELLRDKTLAEHRSQLIGLGYDDALASSTAQAMVDGDASTVFANQKAHLAAQEKALRASILQDTPVPPAGDGGTSMTKEKFLGLNTTEQNEYIKDNPDWMSSLE